MVPYRSHGRGSLELDRLWQGVRIRVASGTQDPALYDELDRMLTALKTVRDWDLRRKAWNVWCAIAHRQLAPLDAYASWRLDGLRGMPDPQYVEQVLPMVERWLPRAATRRGRDLAETSKHDYRQAWARLEAFAPQLTLDRLPEVLRAYRATARPDTFNMARTAVLSFVRSELGEESALWRAVKGVVPRAPVRKSRIGYPPEEARQIAAAAGDLGLVWWTLCTTGMRVKSEYLANRWRVTGDRIAIEGTKSEAAIRVVPLLATPIRWETAVVTRAGLDARYERLRTRLKERTGVTAHQARYTYQHWLQEAGIPDARRDYYFGHGLAGLKVYGRHEFERYVREDVVRLQAVVGEPFQAVRLA